MRPSEDKSAIARAASASAAQEVEEDGNLTLSVWLTQHTYYYGEPIKGLISATVNVPDLAVISIKSILKCIVKRNTFSHGVHSLVAYNEAHDFLSGVDLLTVDTGEQEFRFRFSPDVFLPSFYSSIGSIKWSLAAIATLSDGRVYRSSEKQGNFRMGCVYHPLTSIHPRVFTESKGWWSSQHTQVSLSKLVHDVGEPIIVKFSAAANHKDININGVHIIQDVLLGDKKISVAVHSLLNPEVSESSFDLKQKIITDEFTMAMNEPTAACAVVYELTLRGKRISFPAPSIDIEIGNGEVVKISYRILMDFSIGTLMRAQKMLTLPFVVSDLCPPEDSLTNIRIMEPPTDKLPDYDKLSTKSKVGRPEAVAPHISAQLNSQNSHGNNSLHNNPSISTQHSSTTQGMLSPQVSRTPMGESTMELMQDDRTSISTFDSQGNNNPKRFFRTLSKKVPKKMSIMAHNAIDQLKMQNSIPERPRPKRSISSHHGNDEAGDESEEDSTQFGRRQTVTLAELRHQRQRDNELDQEHLMGGHNRTPRDRQSTANTHTHTHTQAQGRRSPLSTTALPRSNSQNAARSVGPSRGARMRMSMNHIRRATSANSPDVHDDHNDHHTSRNLSHNNTTQSDTAVNRTNTYDAEPPRYPPMENIPSLNITDESDHVRRRSSYMRNDDDTSVDVPLPTYNEVVASREGGLSAQRNWW